MPASVGRWSSPDRTMLGLIFGRSGGPAHPKDRYPAYDRSGGRLPAIYDQEWTGGGGYPVELLAHNKMLIAELKPEFHPAIFLTFTSVVLKVSKVISNFISTS